MKKDNVLISLEGGDCAGKGTQIKKLAHYFLDKNKTILTGLYEPGSTNEADIIRALLKNRLDTNRLPEEFSKTFNLIGFQHLFSRQNIPDTAQMFLKKVEESRVSGIKHDIVRFLAHGERLEDSEFEHAIKKCNYDAKKLFEEYLKSDVLTPTEQLNLFLAGRNMIYENLIIPSEADVILLDRSVDSSVVYQGHALGEDVQEIRRQNTVATRGYLPDITLYIDLSVEEALKRKALRAGQQPDFFDDLDNSFHEQVRNGYLAEAKFYENYSSIHGNLKGRIIVIDGMGSPDEVHERIIDALEERVLF